MKKALFIGYNALGDTLCTTPVLRAFRKSNPGVFVIYLVQNSGFCRVLDGNPDIDLVLYSEVLYANRGVKGLGIEWLRTLPLDLQEDAPIHHFDLQQAVTSNEHFQQHIAQNFARLLNIPIDSTLPTIVITEEERRMARPFVHKPYLVFSMHSVTNPEREGGEGRMKDWPAQQWFTLAHALKSTLGFDVIALGAENDPQYQTDLVRNLYGLPIKVAAALIESAEAFVTLENGLAHLAAGLNAPTIEIFANHIPRPWAHHDGLKRCRTLFCDPRELKWETVYSAIQQLIGTKEPRP